MRRLDFAAPDPNTLVSAIASAVAAAKGGARVRFGTINELARATAQRLKTMAPHVVLEAEQVPADAAGLGFVPPSADPAPVVALCETDGEALGAALAAYADRQAAIVAPITDRFWNRRSLFLISIPKSGTHLLTELARAFGYLPGEEAPANPIPGAWHYLEFTNSHTAAPDFFIDTVRRQPHGNRAHPFPHHPSLFIYRNPLDIVTSEANYYQEDGSTVFAGYLDGLDYDQRLLRLIDDPWLMGSIRDRVGKFAAWLEFGSVIPVSFEEMVGPQGGGDANVQQDTIWSLMLRLQVPGDPVAIGAQVFNPNSPTFRSGRIGGHKKRFGPATWGKFRALKQDFMAVYGFGAEPATGPWLPARAGEFRRRPLRYSKVDPGATPFLVRQNFLGHNILRFRGKFWAMPHGFPFGDLTKAPEAALAQLSSADDQATVEFMTQAKMMMAFANRKA